ncbi:hypothetical protein PG988_006718 [Apiospora saccharicola]
MQTKTLFIGLTIIASALAAPVPASGDNSVTTQDGGAGIWTRAEATAAEKREEDAIMHTEGAGVWTRAEVTAAEKREEDAIMHTEGAGVWTRADVTAAEKREEDAIMHTEGAGVWTRAEVRWIRPSSNSSRD